VLSTIEVFSDFVCPFCYLAEQPLADAVEGTDVQIAWQPFELRPEPTPTLRPEGDYLQSVDVVAGGLSNGRSDGRAYRAA
jgi:predicted DsbA family dithiol-disulfide isomerase